MAKLKLMEDLPDRLDAGEIDPALPKTAQVYSLLRRSIIGLELAPGTGINEKNICERLGVSRTPVREALLKLQSEALVGVKPNAGTYVAPIDLKVVLEGHLVRDALEMKLVRMATRTVTDAFVERLELNMYQQRLQEKKRQFSEFYDLDEEMHQMICEHVASPSLWRLVTGAKAQLDRVRMLQIPQPDHMQVVLAEHDAITSAIKSANSQQAEAAMKSHLNRVFKTIRDLLDSHSKLFESGTVEDLDAFEAIARSASST